MAEDQQGGGGVAVAPPPEKAHWANGTPYKANPDAAYTAIMDLKARHHGVIQPRVLVDEARDPTHPLHNEFEWDDTLAAEAWREEQARHIIIAIRIERIDGPTLPPIRVFIPERRVNPDAETKRYVHVREIRGTDTELQRERDVRNAVESLHMWLRRYQEWPELSGLVEWVAEALDEFERG